MPSWPQPVRPVQPQQANNILPLFGHTSTAKTIPAPIPAYDPPVPYHLMQLFQKVPKTENHLHLSGSVPERTIEKFMRENGLDEAQIKQQLGMLKSEYKDLNDFLATYYVVPAHVKTKAQFKEATLELVKEAARENVRVMEVRSSVLGKGDSGEELIDAIQDGLREGSNWVKKHHGFDMKVSYTVLAQRYKDPKEALEHAKLAVKKAAEPGSLVRGFDLAGSESDHSLEKFQEAFDYINQYGKPLGMGLTIHAGETPMSESLSGTQAIRKALSMGADRIGHGIQAESDEELRQLLIKKQIPIEVCTWSNVQLGYVDPYDKHPLSNFLRDGMNVSLSTDNRMMSQITLTRQLGQLWAHGVVKTWDDLVRLTLNGVRMSFLPADEKKAAEQEVIAEFKDLERRYAKTIDQYLPRAPQDQRVWFG